MKQELASLEGSCGFFGDADPDGLISTFLAASFTQTIRFAQPPTARFTRSPLDRFDILIAEGMGFRQIAGFDLWQVYQSDEALEQLEESSITKLVVFDHHPSPKQPLFQRRLLILNPYLKEKRTSRCVTDLIFEAIHANAKTSKQDRFWRDLDAIGIVADRCVEGSQQLIKAVVSDYREFFTGTLANLLDESVITSQLANDSEFRRAVDLFWAPYFVEGPAGVLETYRGLLENEPFDLRDILSEESDHPVLSRLGTLRKEMSARIKKMYEKPRRVVELPEGRIVVFEVDGPYQEAYTSNLIADANPGWIVVVKTRMNSVSDSTRNLLISDSRWLDEKDREEFLSRRLGMKTIKYSVRRRRPGPNLGRILMDLGVGGGHPEAAGAVVAEEAAGRFENMLVDRIMEETRAIQGLGQEINAE